MSVDEKRVVEREKTDLQNREQAPAIFGRHQSWGDRAARYITRDKDERLRHRAIMRTFSKCRQPDR
jgi:hypothetical protein